MAAPAAALSTPHRAFLEELERGASEAVSSAGLHSEEVTIGRTRFDMRFAGSALRDAYFPAFARPWAPSANGPGVTITFWDSESSGVAPPSSPFRPGDLVSRRGEVAAGGDALIRILCIPGLPVFTAWDAGRRSAIVWARGIDALPGYELAHPVRTILQWALEPDGLQLVHAACVAGPGGGVLLAGYSGAGKSTTALACVERGLAYLGDDMVALEAGPDPRAYCVYSAAKLDAGSIEMLGGLDDIPRAKPVEDPPKSVLLLADSRCDRIRDEIPLRAVVAPTTAAGPGLRPTSGGLLLRTIVAPSVMLIPGDASAVMQCVASVLRTVPSYELGLDGDPGSAVDVIAKLCDGPEVL